MRPMPPHAVPPLRYPHTVNTRKTLNSSADHAEVAPPAMHHTHGRDELRLVRTAVNTGHLLKTIPPRTTQRWSLPQCITLTGGTSSASSALPALPTHSQYTQNTLNSSADHTEVVPPQHYANSYSVSDSALIARKSNLPVAKVGIASTCLITFGIHRLE